MDYELKRLLEERCRCKMSDELFERFIGLATEITLKDKEVLIPYGKIDTNLYIQKDGVLRTCYFDGETEKTYGFSDPGAPSFSYHSHFMRQPAVFQVVSCGETVVLKISKKHLDELINDSHEFAKWMLALWSIQPYFNEYKFTNITGQAKERYLWMLENRPEVIARVPIKVMASYLGVRHTYLSRIRKTMWNKK
jgi:signal-transduction protein with cAMP-binding, CBS, and nucleotidyltransferase domain